MSSCVKCNKINTDCKPVWRDGRVVVWCRECVRKDKMTVSIVKKSHLGAWKRETSEQVVERQRLLSEIKRIEDLLKSK